MRLRFLKPVLILSIILAALLAYPLSVWLVDVRPAVIAAAIMALANAIIGMVIIELTLDKPNFVFMAAFFGGMGLRIFLILFVFAFLLTQNYHAMTLTFFLMGFYFAFMVIEIRFMVKVLSRHKGQRVQRA